MDITMIETILTPLSYPFDPSKRIFWGFLLSSLLMACVAISVSQQSTAIKQQLLLMASWRYWVNLSVFTDLCLLFLNSSIRLMLLVPAIGVRLAAAIAVASFLQVTLGDAPLIDLSWWLVGAFYSICYFVAEDSSRFLLHYISHKNPLLWHFHKVHHSATVLTPLTIHRVHPVEMTLYFFRGMAVFGLVGGVFIYVFRGQIDGWDILGVEAFGFLFNALGANLRHTPLWVSFGRLEKVFVSPAQHQIHHSVDMAHRDKNMGTCLAIWDRIMGSWVPAKNTSVQRYGLTCAEATQVG